MAKKAKSQEDAIAQRMMELFAGFAGAHGTHGEPRRRPDELKWEIRSTARTLREPVTVELWRKHLNGERPLGIITIREDNTCKWGSIDYDVYDADLLDLIARVDRMKLPLVPVRSKSGGLHLFMFMNQWTPAASVQAVLRDMAAQLGVAGSEIFPKQTQVMADRGDLGSWIVMPYFGSTYGGKLHTQVGLKKTGAEMDIEEFLIVAKRATVTEDDLPRLTRKRATRPAGGGRGRGGGDPSPEPSEPFGDGPPCLQTLASDKVPKGHQNNALFMMGIYFRRKYATEWKEKLEEAARDYLDPPGSAEGTASVIRSLDRKDYEYTCKIEPMCSYCNVTLCRSRKYGVGAEGEYPTMNLRRLMTDPPIWFVEVDGKTMEMDVGDLLSFPQFQRHAANTLGRCFGSIKQSDWYALVNAAMQNREDLQAPSDSGRKGQFHELLEEFCTNRQRGTKVEDLLSRRPYYDEDGGAYFIRLGDLQDFLNREGMRDMTRSQITARLRDIGEPAFFNVKGKGIRAWRIPASTLETTPQLSTPDREEGAI